MKQDWRSVDWVELGCRGWEIDESGAEWIDPRQEDYAHLDRKTLHLVVGATPAHFVRIINDLIAAHVYCIESRERSFSKWELTDGTTTAGSNTPTTINAFYSRGTVAA